MSIIAPLSCERRIRHPDRRPIKSRATLNPTAPDATGQVFADVVTSCTATTANFTLRVTDSDGLFSEATLAVTVNRAPTPMISPTDQTFTSSGGTGAVEVTNSCPWTAVSNDSWITVTSGSSGTGNGTVGYSVAANISLNPRTGTITIAGRTFTVAQAAVVCTFSISPTSRSHGPGAEADLVAVTTPSVCNWTALSNDSWITVTSGSSGTGNGSVGYALSANASPSPRHGTITIADQIFTVNQSGITCTFSLGAIGHSFGPAGGTDAFDVTTQSLCPWTAMSNNVWIIITSGGSGTGNGTVNYTVDSNPSVNPRTGTITVARQTFTVDQAGIAAVGLSSFKTDFDSDGKTDIAFYRAGLWGFLKSAQSYNLGSAQFFSWGGSMLQPICADFDGDGKADIAYIVPPSGGQSASYAILQSSRNYSFAPGDVLFVPAGFPVLGDTPVVGDFDGDGKADPGIWRASEGVWIVPKSSTNYTGYIFSQWGQLGDIPVIADFDMDGKTDIGFYRNGLWGVLKSAQNYSLASAQFFSWGGTGLQPIVGDFDGDAKADIGYIVPPSGGQSAAYAILKSSTGYSFLPGNVLFVAAGFPVLGDTPVVGDFDGDGKADPGIWRESQGVWILPRSSSNNTMFIFSQWGQAGDIAFPNSTGKH
jgi:hypothetical protein